MKKKILVWGFLGLYIGLLSAQDTESIKKHVQENNQCLVEKQVITYDGLLANFH
jgi:hypothetical protein